VLVGARAASRKIYALGMKCTPKEIMSRWAEAQINPIKPKVVTAGTAQEEVHMGEGLLEHGQTARG
jgi:hypothetical protein